jgi:hypothetical protein
MAQRTREADDGAAGVHNCRLRVQQAVHSRVAGSHGGRVLSVEQTLLVGIHGTTGGEQ